MNMRHYADTQRSKLAAVLEREELSCYYRAVVQGPLTLTWRLLPHQPDTGTIKRLLGLGSVLQSAMLVESVRVQQVAGMIEIQIPSPQPMTPNADNMLTGSNGLSVALGWDSMSKPVAVDLARHGAIAWVGPSRRGKTQALRSTLYSAAAAVGDKLRYAILAQPAKITDWAAFDNSKHSLGIASEPGEMVACVRWFAGYARQGTDGYRLVLVIDDLPSILAVANIAPELGFIASNGAGVGVHVWLGTQMLGSNAGSGGQLIESNVSARIVYKPASNATGARNSGIGGLDTGNLSTHPGDAVALVDGHAERVATARCGDETVSQLPQGRRVKWWRAWAGEGGSKAGSSRGSKAGSNVVLDGSPAVDGGVLRLPTNTMPDPAQRRQLYEIWKKLGSKRQALFAVFGCKNGNVAEWLDMAIRENEKIINMAERRAV